MTTSIVLKSVRGSRLEHFRAKVSEPGALRCSSQVPPATFLLHVVLVFLFYFFCVAFVVLATAIVGNSNKRTTNVVGVAGNGRRQKGDGWGNGAVACQGNAFKPFSFSFSFTFTFTFAFPLKQITQKMSFCRKDKASQAPGIVNILFRFLVPRFLANPAPKEDERYIKGQ